MKITILAHANIRHYFADKNEVQEIDVSDTLTLGELMHQFQIPESEIMLLMINKTIAPKDQIPKENDVVEIFPILAGG